MDYLYILKTGKGSYGFGQTPVTSSSLLALKEGDATGATAGSGMTEVGGEIDLGGTLTKEAGILLDGNNFVIDNVANGGSFSINEGSPQNDVHISAGVRMDALPTTVRQADSSGDDFREVTLNVDGDLTSYSNTDWVTVTPVHGAATQVRYRRVNGKVYIGFFNLSGVSDNTTIFTLPTDFRPMLSSDGKVHGGFLDTTSGTVPNLGIYIDTNGSVTADRNGGGFGKGTVSFDLIN